VLLKPYAEYYDEYAAKVQELLEQFPLGQPIIGESAQKAFIALFGQILRLQNILTSFDDFAGNEILSDRQGQDYRSVYLDLYATPNLKRTRTQRRSRSLTTSSSRSS
jgi:type I restriction enzyme R subunit